MKTIKGLFVLRKTIPKSFRDALYRGYAYYNCPGCENICNTPVGISDVGGPSLGNQTFKIKERMCNICGTKTYIDLLNLSKNPLEEWKP